MNGLFIILGIVGLIVIIIIGDVISISNRFNRYSIKIEEADSGIDIALTKRYDVLTKMMEVVKKYTQYEKETMFEVIKLRKGMTPKEKS